MPQLQPSKKGFAPESAGFPGGGSCANPKLRLRAGHASCVGRIVCGVLDVALEEPIDGAFEIKLAPIVGELLEDKPIDWAEKDGAAVARGQLRQFAIIRSTTCSFGS